VPVRLCVRPERGRNEPRLSDIAGYWTDDGLRTLGANWRGFGSSAETTAPVRSPISGCFEVECNKEQ